MAREYLPTKSRMLHRPRVEALLRQGLLSQFTAVVAPPGYGKTQAVAAFVKKSKRRLIWLELSQRENDVFCFWGAVVSALQYEFPELAAQYPQRDYFYTLQGYDLFIEAFAKELYTGRSALLVVENYNLITNEEVRGIVRSFIDLRLENLSIILLSNTKSDLQIARERYGQEHSIITGDQLRFTKQETAELYRLYGKKIHDPELEMLWAKSEGWPLVVYLACRYGDDSLWQEPGAPPYALHVEELFEIGYYSAYSQRCRQLLAGLAHLPAFSFDIVKKLAGDAFGEMEGILTSNIFIAHDAQTHLLSFHKMYRDFLSGKRYVIGDELLYETHCAAATWYQKNGFYLEAIGSFFEAGRYDELLGVLLNVPIVRQTARWSNSVLSYLDELPEEYAEGNATVLFCKAFMHLNNLEFDLALAQLTEVKGLLEQSAASAKTEWLGEIYAVLADISIAQNNIAFVEHIKKARECLPRGSQFRGSDLMIVGNNEVFYLPGNEAGQAEVILDCVFKAASDKEHVYGPHGAGYEWLFGAEYAFLIGDYEKAKENCLKAILKAEDCKQHDIVVNAHFVMARSAAMQADFEQAKRHHGDIMNYLRGNQWTGADEMRGFFESWYYLVAEDYAKLPRWVTEFNYAHHALMRNDSGRGIMLYIWYLMLKEQYTEALAYIEQQKSVAEKKGLWTLVLRSHLVEACCHMRLGQSKSAIDAFGRAYEMAYANGITTPFVSQGNEGKMLCDLARRSGRAQFDSGWLDSVAEQAEQAEKGFRQFKKTYRDENPAISMGKALTAREKTVLQHLALGKTREEIAGAMGISVSGVKSHIGNIYNKLGAVNRSDAIRKAVLAGEMTLKKTESDW